MIELSLWTWLAILLSVLAGTAASICYKKASGLTGKSAILYFNMGLLVGFLNPVFKTLALRGNNPNVIFAIMNGLGGILFVLIINWVFKGRLTRLQWFAILLIVIGSFILQLQPSKSREGSLTGVYDAVGVRE